jgi:hypothetical protein
LGIVAMRAGSTPSAASSSRNARVITTNRSARSTTRRITRPPHGRRSSTARSPNGRWHIIRTTSFESQNVAA